MIKQHPITPPPELVEQWRDEWIKLPMTKQHPINPSCTVYQYIATQAARWGADQELEACCEYIGAPGRMTWFATPQFQLAELRATRRPKPLSPKEEALQVLEDLIESRRIVDPEYQALRHALEQLND